MAYRILLVEDNLQIQEVINDYFIGKSNGELELIMVSDGEEAMCNICVEEYDLILLDIMLPGVDGYTICRKIREKSIVPIIFITAKVYEDDMLHGYGLGCDDYITKPFSLSELYAKVNALLKRYKGLVGSPVLKCGDITLNPGTHVVRVEDEPISLPPKQYELLKYLLEKKEQPVERDTLLSRVWGSSFYGNDRVVDNHIKKLRKALGSSGRHIKTEISKGYKITEEL
jgi:DNA-binding response OmpR family regulator